MLLFIKFFNYLVVIIFTVRKCAVTAILYAVWKHGVIALAIIFIKRAKTEKTVDFVNPAVAGIIFALFIFKKFIAHINRTAIPHSHKKS